MQFSANELKDVMVRLRSEIAKVIIGQDDVITCALIAVFTNNHALIEGVPGIAKTLLVRTLAKVLGCESARVQFTPDLMPSDITGTNVFDFQNNQFNLVKGPIFTDFLLADEINRAPAKTQAALLQAMQERCVTIDRDTLQLDKNFTVFATQNPIEYEGTYPLPEAQKDRFMLKISMECPNLEDELALATRMLGDDSPEQRLASGQVETIVSPGQLAELRHTLNDITVRQELLEYLVNIVRATRTHETVLIGASPRATQALLQAGRAHAALDQRDFVSPDDIKLLAPSVLAHRLVLRPEYEIEGHTVAESIDSILQEVTVPR
jgi:MoxR-like ATPase